MTEVKNIRSLGGQPIPVGGFYIGRGGGSKLGNPYTHLTTNNLAKYQVATVEEAIAKFDIYIRDLVEKDEEIAELVKSLVSYDALYCWCKPRPCHGDALLKLSLELNQ